MLYLYLYQQGDTLNRVLSESPPENPPEGELLGTIPATLPALLEAGIWKRLREGFDYGDFTYDEIITVFAHTKAVQDRLAKVLSAKRAQLAAVTPPPTERLESWELRESSAPAPKTHPNDCLTDVFNPLFSLKG